MFRCCSHYHLSKFHIYVLVYCNGLYLSGLSWCFWTAVLEKTLESPLDCEEIKPVNSKGNQSWIFSGRTDAGTWVWASSRRWWCTGKPGVLQSIGSQSVGHDWATEQQQLRNNENKQESNLQRKLTNLRGRYKTNNKGETNFGRWLWSRE